MKKQIIFTVLLFSFYLGTHNGRLALWETGQTSPVEVYPYSTSVYTKTDQNELAIGIRIDTKSEITKHLDDFLS